MTVMDRELIPAGRWKAAALSADERRRYSRHLLLPEVSADGQRKLKAARVLCIGAGGLGSPLAMYLAAAGVGTLGLVDFDVVDASNLQRQILHGTADVGRPKLVSAAETLAALNPHVRLEAHETQLSGANALELVGAYDLVVDGTDNFPARYLVNDACVLLGKPNVYGAILRFEGQATVFGWGGPCYRCLFPEPPPPGRVPSCAEAGVLGVLPGMIGMVQATEALKLIVGAGEPLVGRLLTYQALKMRWRELAIARDPGCPLCGDTPTITDVVELTGYCTGAADSFDISPAELRERRARGSWPVVVDVREPEERAAASIPDTLHIPLGELPARAGELDPAAEIVLVCQGGMRSRKALEQLRQRGFRRLRNLAGGMLAWQAEE